MAEAHDSAHDVAMKIRAEQIKNNEERMAFDARQRPTPSPDELLAAQAGKPMEAKDHGAAVQHPSDPPHMHLDPHKRKDVTKKASPEGQDATYQTRASTKG